MFEESVDIARAEVEASGMTIEMIDRQYDDLLTTWFAKQPSNRTWLTADVVNTGGITVTVQNTANISVGDVVHIGTEAMLVDTVPTSATFTVATAGRGYWSTIQQYHFAGDGDRLVDQVVTVARPITIEGRHAYLYRYVIGEDDLTGAGTAVWTGVCTKDARCDGGLWSVLVDPIYSILKQDLGGDLDEPFTIRGIRYPENAPLQFEIRTTTGTDRGLVSVSGFWETQADFVDHLNDSGTTGTLADAVSGWTEITNVLAVVTETGHWGIEWMDGSYEAEVLHFGRGGLAVNIDGTLIPSSLEGPSATLPRRLVTGDGGTTQKGLVPRGVFGVGSLGDAPDAIDGSAPANHIYIEGSTSTSDADAVTIKWPPPEAGDDGPKNAVEITSGQLEIREGFTDGIRFMYPGHLPEIRLVRTYILGGSLADWRDDIVGSSATEANLGAMPLITNFDFASWATAVERAANGRAFLLSRAYTQAGSVEAMEFLKHECRLLGCFPRIGSSQTIELKQLELPTATSITTLTVDDSVILADKQPPTWERNAKGSVNKVVIKTGYSSIDDEHKGPTFTVIDMQAMATRKAPRKITIEPRSRSHGVDLDYYGAVEIAQRVLGLFGRPYVVVTCEVPYTLLTTALIGESVAFSSHRLPDVITGRRGLGTGAAAASGLIISRSWELGAERGALEILISDQTIAGYTPTVSIDSTAVVSGNQYDLTVSFTDPEGTATMAPGGAVLSDFFAVSDYVDLMTWDSASVTPLRGVVDAVTDGGPTLQVTFDSAPSFSGKQYIRYADSGSASTSQAIYAYYADTGIVSFATPADAREFAS
ncbi:MAG: hypothetical protein GY944_29620 [bacterium]|nr:hypothetical protein [bacterium]